MTQTAPSVGQVAVPEQVPILTYHSLDTTGSVLSISPEVFRGQMDALRDWGFQGVALRDLLDAWEGRAPLPPRPVVLTFDDGFRNFLDHAAAVLLERDFRATIFVVAGHCGGTNDWPTDPPGIPRLPLLSWSELRDLAGAGFEVGAHTMTHPPLPLLSMEEAAWQIGTSQEVLQDRLGCAVTSFSYPYGATTKGIQDLVSSHYQGACSTRLGLAGLRDARHLLRRVEMYYYRSPLLFRLFPTLLGRLYLALRSIARSWRAPHWTPPSLRA